MIKGEMNCPFQWVNRGFSENGVHSNEKYHDPGCGSLNTDID